MMSMNLTERDVRECDKIEFIRTDKFERPREREELPLFKIKFTRSVCERTYVPTAVRLKIFVSKSFRSLGLYYY